MKYYETEGTYGSNKTPCTVLVCEYSTGLKWYCADGSSNVNATHDYIFNGVDIEELSDCDYFSYSSPIETIEELETAIEA